MLNLKIEDIFEFHALFYTKSDFFATTTHWVDLQPGVRWSPGVHQVPTHMSMVFTSSLGRGSSQWGRVVAKKFSLG